MEMHQIRYFLMVSKTLNFTRAAEQCHVAQPSLTRAIKKLEDELGGELFHREGRRTHLTDLGNTMLPLLTQSYDFAVAASEQAKLHGTAEIANLRLGLSNSIDIRVLMPAIKALSRALPELELKVTRGTAGEIEQNLEDGLIEVAVTAHKSRGWERINHWLLFTENFIVAINPDHALATQDGFKLEDLSDQHIIWRAHCEVANTFSTEMKDRHISAKISHEVDSKSDLQALLADNLGIGLVPGSMEFGSTGIIRLPINDAEIKRSLELLAVAGRQYSKPAALFINLVRAADWSAYED